MFISKKFNEIKLEFDNNKNSHSYMIYTNDFFSCKKDIENLLKQLFNVENLKLVDNDFIVVEKSDKKNILKEDVQNIVSFFQKTTYVNNYRIYLIEEAHKLNSNSANMILKFLEEPNDRVIAFFITTNLDAVLSTIKSRCQIISVFYNLEENKSSEINIIKNFICDNNKYFSIIKAKEYFKKYERGELIELFNDFLNICYKDLFNIENAILIKKINKCISLLNNNVSVDYVFDYLFLGSGELDEYSKCEI